jgi:hypothetical protein
VSIHRSSRHRGTARFWPGSESTKCFARRLPRFSSSGANSVTSVHTWRRTACWPCRTSRNGRHAVSRSAPQTRRFVSTHPAPSCNSPHLEICAPKSLRLSPFATAPRCYRLHPFRLAAVCFVGLRPASVPFAVVRLPLVRLAATRFASLRLAAVAVATDSLHRLLSSHVFRSACLFRCSRFVVSASLFLGRYFWSVVRWSFVVFRVSCFAFPLCPFLFDLCFFPSFLLSFFPSFLLSFFLSSFFFLLFDLALLHKLCIRRRLRRDMRDGGVAVGRIGTAAGSGTVGGAHT